jgi:hypothetical protein
MEAIKSAVQYGLGAALVSSAAIAKEMDLGLFCKLDIAGVRLTRTLSLVRAPDQAPCFSVAAPHSLDGRRPDGGPFPGISKALQACDSSCACAPWPCVPWGHEGRLMYSKALCLFLAVEYST